MALDEIAAAWSAMQEDAGTQIRALVVDDEEIVLEVILSILELSGWSADGVGSAEEAIDRLRAGSYDLLVTDKNLPGHDGVDLISQVRAEGLDVPSVLVTGYPSAETISRALAHGASDYIAKPFDDVGHVQRRLESVVEQHRMSVVYERIVTDLKTLLERGGAGAETVSRIARELSTFKAALSARPDVLIVERDARMAQLTGLFLQRAGLRVVHADGRAGLREQVCSDDGPLAVFLGLDERDPAGLVAELVAGAPQLSVVVSGRSRHLDLAVAAVAAGAMDFVMGAVEGLDLMVTRVRRAVARSRRHRLYLHLLATLYREAQAMQGETSVALARLLPESQRTYLTQAVAPVVEEEIIDLVDVVDVDLDDLLHDADDELDLEVTVGPMTDARAPGGASGLNAGAEATLAEQIAYGIDQVDAERTVEVPLRDLLFVYGTVGELIRFFHEPSHWAEPEAVRAFVGDAEGGALSALIRSYYDDLRALLPPDVVRDLDAGRFDHPRRPSYGTPRQR